MTFKNGTFDGVRQVVVENFGAGTITVEPHADGSAAGPDVVEASLNAADDRLLAEAQLRHEQDQLRVVLPSSLFRNSTAHLRLTVPPGLGFLVKAGSADVSISADIGRSKISCGSGDVSVGRALDLDCTTGSGDVSVARVDGSGARLGSGSGDVVVGEAHCPVSAKSGSGDITVRNVRRSALEARSGSGDIAVPSTTGSVDLKSASGSVTVGIADDLPAWLDLSSVSGAVRIALESTQQPEDGAPYVTVRARTASGDIAVYRA